MKEETPKVVVVDASKENLFESVNTAMHEAMERKAEATRQIEEATNPLTQDDIVKLASLRNKVISNSPKFSKEELLMLWMVIGKQIVRYQNGHDHVCEFVDGDATSNCILCGESL